MKAADRDDRSTAPSVPVLTEALFQRFTSRGESSSPMDCCAMRHDRWSWRSARSHKRASPRVGARGETAVTAAVGCAGLFGAPANS